MNQSTKSLANAEALGIDTNALSNAWREWQEGHDLSGTQLAAHIEKHSVVLETEIDSVRAEAAQKLKEREDLWRPVAQALNEWLPAARKMLTEAEVVGNLKKSQDWIRTTGTAIRNERFQPIKEEVKEIWELLRTQSDPFLSPHYFGSHSHSSGSTIPFRHPAPIAPSPINP